MRRNGHDFVLMEMKREQWETQYNKGTGGI
jgi:hypothetical protein